MHAGLSALAGAVEQNGAALVFAELKALFALLTAHQLECWL
jgi:hypothetical protein